MLKDLETSWKMKIPISKAQSAVICTNVFRRGGGVFILAVYKKNPLKNPLFHFQSILDLILFSNSQTFPEILYILPGPWPTYFLTELGIILLNT